MRARAILGETPNGLKISIPSRKNPFMLIFLPVWLVGWAFGEFFVARTIVVPPGGSPAPILFLVVWLTFWTLGGAFAIYAFLWTAVGREVVLLRPDALVIRSQVFNLGRSREYDLNAIRNLRVAATPFNPFDFRSGLQFWGIGGGLIAFDYGAGTIRFGSAVQEGEASDIVSNLKRRYPFAVSNREHR